MPNLLGQVPFSPWTCVLWAATAPELSFLEQNDAWFTLISLSEGWRADELRGVCYQFTNLGWGMRLMWYSYWWIAGVKASPFLRFHFQVPQRHNSCFSVTPAPWTNFRQHPRVEIGRSRIVSGQITRIPKSELRSFWEDSHTELPLEWFPSCVFFVAVIYRENLSRDNHDTI